MEKIERHFEKDLARLTEELTALRETLTQAEGRREGLKSTLSERAASRMWI